MCSRSFDRSAAFQLSFPGYPYSGNGVAMRDTAIGKIRPVPPASTPEALLAGDSGFRGKSGQEHPCGIPLRYCKYRPCEAICRRHFFAFFYAALTSNQQLEV